MVNDLKINARKRIKQNLLTYRLYAPPKGHMLKNKQNKINKK